RGTESAVVELLAPAQRAPRIVYPAPATIIALDPDIPAPLQRVSFHAQAGQGLRWELDGKARGPADADEAWAPEAGAHELKLVASDGKAVAETRFEVRGALR
ncbi:MAG TPA: penicillin-binding protein 1C, partial [Telluria sp.]